ncbi:hypothetical protein CSKR_200538 [Clonorchis sinensis]|uniref:Uncharacterized protein n=1 Tax=Clonorchis sinensis TaxID=79923 RepID=A0A8T1MEK9_CLOSI|nr:hypothetical protein CSKR_200538 [Clonorchis sinensis]
MSANIVQSRERVENVVVVQTSLPLLDCVYIRYSSSFEAIRSYLPKSTTNESEKYNQRTACIWFTIDADLGFGSCGTEYRISMHHLLAVFCFGRGPPLSFAYVVLRS